MKDSVLWQDVVLAGGRRTVAISVALAFVLASMIGSSSPAQAQTYKLSVLHTFTGGADGASVDSGLLMDKKGILWGSAYLGGTDDDGVAFKLNPTTREETPLYTFTNDGATGRYPVGHYVMDAKGNLYGTTEHGGDGSGDGVAYKLDPTTRKVTVLHTFSDNSPGGGWPQQTGLVMDAKGNLYGTTQVGGTYYGSGVVFKLDSATREETVLHTFTGGADGGTPLTSLIMDAKGNLYGTTTEGGASNNGVVFKLDPTTRHETVLHSFTGGPDGGLPQGVLIWDAKQENIYGTTLLGGKHSSACYSSLGCGVVYKLDPATHHETVLYSFTPGKDGSNPSAGLTSDANGNLYGVASVGGKQSSACSADGCGVVFKVEPATHHETVLYSFTGGADGANPQAELIFDENGSLYGGTMYGGDLSCGYIQGCGTVFKLTPQYK